MLKKILFFFLASAVLNGCAGPSEEEISLINSFESCAEAGYPVMESYPRQCAVPGKRTFAEIIEDTENKDVDEHGCLIKEGFAWCQEAEQCLKENEECKKDPDVTPRRSYYLIEQALLKKREADFAGKTLGIRSLSLSHFRGRMADEPEGVILAAKRNNEWVIVHDGIDDYTCESVKPYYFPKSMIGDCRL
ncbi:hypothetical protein JW752_02875 [Candidatus Peregrinibacteria bacterium]|nr:hypothetical protein [Candidatus Peregrinibacteria bacterium]